MPTGQDVVTLAKTRIGEKYVLGASVPKNNPNWKGPWDCSEFASWLVYQTGGYLFGCINDAANPAVADAYSGAWQKDAQSKGHLIDIDQAAGTIGAFVLRYPPHGGGIGHVVVSDGDGGTIEAMGAKWGVRTAKFANRHWDTGLLLPGFTYAGATTIGTPPPEIVYRVGAPNMRRSVVRAIQQAVGEAGYDPGPIDGVYGANTAAAVAAFQQAHGLVVDGQVGPSTAAKLVVDIDPD